MPAKNTKAPSDADSRRLAGCQEILRLKKKPLEGGDNQACTKSPGDLYGGSLGCGSLEE